MYRKIEIINLENAGIMDSKLFNVRLISSYIKKVGILFFQCFNLESGSRVFSKPYDTTHTEPTRCDTHEHDKNHT